MDPSSVLTALPLTPDVLLWVVFGGAIAVMLALDLFVFHRHAHVVTMREAAIWSVVWVALGLVFGALLFVWRGGAVAGEYFAGYLIEKSLSVDNVFLFATIFAALAVPAAYQHRVLFWGVVGAIVLRAIFVVAGAALLETFHWTLYVFGALLVFTGIKMARASGHAEDPQQNAMLRLVRRVLPLTNDYRGPAFVVREGGRWLATPLLAALVAVELTDVMFAVDSIPAIFAVTRDPFLVFTSNAFAILGLRSLYFLLAGLVDRFVYLKVALGALLVFVGSKMLLSDVLKVPLWLSLGVIVLTVAVGVVASLRATRDLHTPTLAARRDEGEGAPHSNLEPVSHVSSVVTATAHPTETAAAESGAREPVPFA